MRVFRPSDAVVPLEQVALRWLGLRSTPRCLENEKCRYMIIRMRLYNRVSIISKGLKGTRGIGRTLTTIPSGGDLASAVASFVNRLIATGLIPEDAAMVVFNAAGVTCVSAGVESSLPRGNYCSNPAHTG